MGLDVLCHDLIVAPHELLWILKFLFKLFHLVRGQADKFTIFCAADKASSNQHIHHFSRFIFKGTVLGKREEFAVLIANELTTTRQGKRLDVASNQPLHIFQGVVDQSRFSHLPRLQKQDMNCMGHVPCFLWFKVDFFISKALTEIEPRLYRWRMNDLNNIRHR